MEINNFRSYKFGIATQGGESWTVQRATDNPSKTAGVIRAEQQADRDDLNGYDEASPDPDPIKRVSAIASSPVVNDPDDPLYGMQIEGDGDEWEYSIKVDGQGNVEVRATSPRQAYAKLRETNEAVAELPSGALSLASARRVTDAEHALAAIEGLDPTAGEEAFDRALMADGRQMEYVDEPGRTEYDSGKLEHYVFADGSVLDGNLEHAHDSYEDYEVGVAEAAHEQMTQDFHAGDSGFRGAAERESEYLQQHAEHQELKGRPSGLGM